MLTLPGEVHFWTLKEDISIPEGDFGAFRYHEKKDASESLYLESKKSYAEGRGISWAVSNKKSSPVKKDGLRELEELLIGQRVVRCEWRRHDLLQLLLSSGLLLSISVNLSSGDIARISSDKFLIGKLPSECLTDVVFGQSHVILAFSEAVLGVVHLGRPLQPPDKLSRQEPRLAAVDLGGPSGRRLERKLCLSADETMVLVWWRCAQDEVYPWSPVVRDCDRANILIYTVTGLRLELLCYYKTEADPISVVFSQQYANLLLLVEQKVSRKGDVSVESSRFEVGGGRLTRSPTVGALQLQTQACCVARSPDETRLALGCIDGSVLLYSPSSTLLAKAAFIPSVVTWHPDGMLVVVANEKGQLQSFDLALAPVRVQLLSEEPACTASLLDITTYFRYQPLLCFMAFNKKFQPANYIASYAPADGYLLLHFERGPLCVVRLVEGGGVAGSQGGLAPDSLISQYLRLNMADCAINLLAALGWDAQGTVCLACLHRVCNYLLARHLTPASEEQLEAALGTFMSPSVPLSLGAERQFGRIVHHLARRFFHHLLRHQRLEKAFQLAIDLGDRDLFLDLYHSAEAVDEVALAQAARRKAAEVVEADRRSHSSVTSSSGSCECSRSSCSACGSSTGEESSDSDTVPPEALLAAVAAKPSKVTFSDNLTHIVEISSGDEEEEEEEDEDDDDEDESEVQALIVSDAPLRLLGPPRPSRPENFPTPAALPKEHSTREIQRSSESLPHHFHPSRPPKPENPPPSATLIREHPSREIQRVSDSHLQHSDPSRPFRPESFPTNSEASPSRDLPPRPDLLVSTSVSYSTSHTTPYSSSRTTYTLSRGPEPARSVHPDSGDYYSLLAGRSSQQDPARLPQFSAAPPYNTQHVIPASEGMDRNSQLRSSISSMVPPPVVHQASITSLSSSKLSPLTPSKNYQNLPHPVIYNSEGTNSRPPPNREILPPKPQTEPKPSGIRDREFSKTYKYLPIVGIGDTNNAENEAEKTLSSPQASSDTSNRQNYRESHVGNYQSAEIYSRRPDQSPSTSSSTAPSPVQPPSPLHSAGASYPLLTLRSPSVPGDPTMQRAERSMTPVERETPLLTFRTPITPGDSPISRPERSVTPSGRRSAESPLLTFRSPPMDPAMLRPERSITPGGERRGAESPLLPLLSVRNSPSPLYLSPFPPRRSQRDLPDTPLFRISNLDIKNSSLLHSSNQESERISSISKSLSDMRFLSSPKGVDMKEALSPLPQYRSTTRLTEGQYPPNPPYRHPPSVPSAKPLLPGARPHLAPQPAPGRSNGTAPQIALHSFRQEAVAEERDESLKNIKVVHFGVV